jgi:ABC-type Na+ efflux pump permease subunit
VLIWTLAKKELRTLLRDRLAAGLLLALPLLFIVVLGVLLGEGFGQKPDDRLRVSLVDEDGGLPDAAATVVGLGASPHALGAVTAVALLGGGPGGHPVLGLEPWSNVVRRDLAQIKDSQGRPGIRIEVLPDREEAKRLIDDHKRPAVLVFQRDFSRRVTSCSFLRDGINPFYHDGVYLDRINAELLRDPKQPAGASLIDQVGQVSLLRVLLPWMIGRAFERLSDPEFIQILGNEVRVPVPPLYNTISLGALLNLAAGNNPKAAEQYRQKVGAGVQAALAQQFSKYNLTGKTWATLTKSADEPESAGDVKKYEDHGGSGFLSRGAQRYQLLVPSYTVMFAFFLVLNVGWVFVAEKRQGTLRRMRAAPVTRGQILLGKLLPYFLLSLFQGLFLLTAGRLLFDMRWGPASWSLPQQLAWLLPVVFSTSLAAMGMALLVAALARSEMQVALYGAVPVLVLALIGGCVLPPEMMPEQAQQISLATPQGWALRAYREVLDRDPTVEPNRAIVVRSCVVLCAFGAGFLLLAWATLRLD